MKVREEEIVVYLHGNEGRRSAWYRVVLKTSSSSCSALSKLKRRVIRVWGEKHTISPPVALLSKDRFGFTGSWTVIGEDIYWAGGLLHRLGFEYTVNKDLFKHNIHHQPTYWEKVCSLNIPRASPFIAAVGRKLALVAGTEYRIRDDNDNYNYDNDNDDDDDDEVDEVDGDDNWRKSGEIYDLDHQTLDYLTSDINKFVHYQTYEATTAVEEEPTQVVFYNLDRGSMLFVDASTGNIVKEDGDRSFTLLAALRRDDTLPPGRQECVSTPPLVFAVQGPPVFHKRTFYWLTSELKLYGYDMDLRRWLQSVCFQRKLRLHKFVPAHPPLLLGLPNGKLLALLSQKPGEFTMASISVHKDVATFTLGVKVEHIQYFHPYDPSFQPTDGIAM